MKIIKQEQDWSLDGRGLVIIYNLIIDDEIITSAKLYINDDNSIDLTSLYTVPNQTNKGYADKLIKHILNENKDKLITILVRDNNNNAINLYKKNGFIISDYQLVNNGINFKEMVWNKK